MILARNKYLLLALTVIAGLALWAGCQSAKIALPTPPATGLHPGPNDPRITYLTARLLEEYHYLQRPLDRELSERFFDGYVDSLDSRHENLLQSDLAEFASYRTNLDRLTTGGRGADLTAAFQIYDRFLMRFQQHNSYVNELLNHEHFRFNTDEKIQLDRRHAPFPKDLEEAKQFWRQHLRYDYLQEKLSRELSESNGIITVRLTSTNAADIGPTLARHNRWSLRMMTNLDSDSVLQIYLNALAHAYDPHSDYFSAPKAADFSIGMNLSLFGIGAQLQEDDGYCTIRELVAGGPAAKSKQIKPKDRVVAVAQGDKPPVDVVDMELEKVVQQIRGPKGTEVRLTLSPADDRTARRVVSLIRDEIKLEDSQAKAKLITSPDGHGGINRLGIIDLPSFYAPVDLSSSSSHATPRFTSVDVSKLIQKLKQEKVSGIILDLRSNPGGSLEEAIKFTGLFIKAGPVVQARNPDGRVQIDSDTDPAQLYDGPLAVMINHFSASASEIAAAALQDYGRAIIVGDTSTHGKGTVQNLNPLRALPITWPAPLTPTNDPGAIKITIRKFYRVSGASTQLKGVIPDIVLPDVLNYSTQIGESALDNPLPWDTIQPANYDKFNLVQPYLAEIQRRSDSRIATNRDFDYVRQDILQFQKSQADRTAPLKESEAIRERQRIAAQAKLRDDERKHRPHSGQRIYEITVKDAELPDLIENKPVAAETNAVQNVSHADKPYSATVAYQRMLAHKTGSPSQTIKPEAGENQSAPPFDPILDETESILNDYISMLSTKRSVVPHP